MKNIHFIGFKVFLRRSLTRQGSAGGGGGVFFIARSASGKLRIRNKVPMGNIQYGQLIFSGS